MRGSLEANIKRYPWFRVAADCHAWIPVFFLYMSSVLPLDQVIQLSAVYYLSVFVLEVPSGYFSDRIGRRTTLMLAAISLMLAYSFFLIGGSFLIFAFGQFFLAGGIALQSGTDTAFHYDSLKALGRENEYEAREAKAEQYGLAMLAIATVSGGALGIIDLRLAYIFSLTGAVAMLALIWRFREPTEITHGETSAADFLHVLLGCIGRLRDPVLGWIFAVMIVLYALAHIVFELYQPYIALLDVAAFDAGDLAPLISGIVIGVSMFGGSLAAKVSVAWQRRLGLVGLLAVSMIIQLSIVGSMAATVSALVLILICTRNFPMSLVHAPVNAAIAPRISTKQRATYLSLQGLSERVVFAVLLFGLSSSIDKGQPVSEPVLLEILMQTLLLGLAAAIFLFLFSPRIRALTNSSEKKTEDA